MGALPGPPDEVYVDPTNTAAHRGNILWTSALSAGIRVVTLGGKLLLSVSLARWLPSEALGAYGLISSTIAIGVFVLGFEYHFFTIRELVRRAPIARAHMLRDQALIHVGILVVCIPLIFVVAPIFTATGLDRALAGWLAALLAIDLIANESGHALVGLARAPAANAVLFLRTSAWGIVLVAVMAALPSTRTLPFVLSSWILGGLASLAVAAVFLARLPWHAVLRAPFDFATVRVGVKTSAPFVLVTGASLSLLHADRYVVAGSTGLAAVGVYVFFASLATALHTVVNSSVSLVRMPTLVEAVQKGSMEVFAIRLRSMFVATLVATVGTGVLMMVGIGPLLGLVGREVFQAERGVFYMLLASFAVRAVADVPLYGLYALHRDWSLLVANASAAIIALSVNLVAVPKFGIRGAAVGSITGHVAICLIAMIMFRRASAAHRGT